MGIWGFGDNSDFSLEIKQGKLGAWHWMLKDGDGKLRALSPIKGKGHGFQTEQAAVDDAREVVNGLGADFKDLDREEA